MEDMIILKQDYWRPLVKKHQKYLFLRKNIHLNPLDFEEFLWSMGDDITMEIMRNHYKSKKAFGSQIYHEIMKRYRHYMCVGGMPQAVEAYIKNKDFSEADSVKQSIISLYCTDMEYQQEENSDHVVNFFERIPFIQ